MGQVLQPDEHNLNLCKCALENSKVVAVPTETVYGLAANALDEIAIKTIFKIKGRPLFNPLIVHAKSLESAEKYALFNSLSRQLANKFWPGPLTMVLPKKEIIPNIVTANLESVAIRCPQHPTLLNLLKKLSFPLAAPSANPFGYVSPTSAKHVNCSLGDKIEFILDGNNSEIGIESTIVDLRNPNKIKILRSGPISKEDLEAVTNSIFEDQRTCLNNKLLAPGMLKSHYSPKTYLEITSKTQLHNLNTSDTVSQYALIFQKQPDELILKESTNIFWLSEKGEAEEIARNFYNVLRTVDDLNYEKIYIEKISNSNEVKGLNVALMDRLNKASKR